MKGSSVVAALFAALLCIGCGEPASPTGPAAAGGSLSLDSAARGGGQGTAAAQSVPFKGSLEGSQTVTPITPPLALVERQRDRHTRRIWGGSRWSSRTR